MTFPDLFTIYGWYNEDESQITKLESLAAKGDENALADLAGIRVELRENLDQNMKTLESLAAKNNVRALLDLGMIYNEGISDAEGEPAGREIIPQNLRKSDLYLERILAENASYGFSKDVRVLALFYLGIHAWTRCCLKIDLEPNAQDENDPSPLSSEDFSNGEKWLLSLMENVEDPDLSDAVKEYCNMRIDVAKGWLSALYKSNHPLSPIHDEKKAKEWEDKSNGQK